jgi:hypothetical protein
MIDDMDQIDELRSSLVAIRTRLEQLPPTFDVIDDCASDLSALATEIIDCVEAQVAQPEPAAPAAA